MQNSLEDANKTKGWKLRHPEKWVCTKHAAALYEGWHTDLHVFSLKNSTKHFAESMYVQKNVNWPQALTSVWFARVRGLMLMESAIHQRQKQRQRGVLLPEAAGQGARQCIICSRERVTWSVLTAVMAALTGMSPRSQPKQIPGAREFVARILRMFTFNGLWTLRKLKRKEALRPIHYTNSLPTKKNPDCWRILCSWVMKNKKNPIYNPMNIDM